MGKFSAQHARARDDERGMPPTGGTTDSDGTRQDLVGQEHGVGHLAESGLLRASRVWQDALWSMPADQWQSIPVPAVIDADLFAAVQAQLQENRTQARTRKRGARYLLQGLLVCKQCGYAYYGKPLSRASRKGHVRHYAYYRCIGSDAYRFGGQRVCTNPQVRTDCLEQAVWQEVRNLLLDPHRLSREYERRLQALAQPAEDVQRRSAENQLRQCRQGVARLIDAYSEGYLEKGEFESRITRLRERQKVLEQQIEQWEDEALSRNELQLIVGRLEDFAAKVTGSLDDMGFEAQRDLIRTLVKRVEIDREQVNVVFRITPPSTSAPGTLESLPDCGRRAFTVACEHLSARARRGNARSRIGDGSLRR